MHDIGVGRTNADDAILNLVLVGVMSLFLSLVADSTSQ